MFHLATSASNESWYGVACVSPLSVMTPYRDPLAASGFATDTVIHVGAGHEWVIEGKTAIPAWFDAHP